MIPAGSEICLLENLADDHWPQNKTPNPQRNPFVWKYMSLYLNTMISSSGRDVQIFFSKNVIRLARNDLYVSLCVSSIHKLTNTSHPKKFLWEACFLADSKFPVKSVCTIDAEEFLSKRNSFQTMDNHYPL